MNAVLFSFSPSCPLPVGPLIDVFFASALSLTPEAPTTLDVYTGIPVINEFFGMTKDSGIHNTGVVTTSARKIGAVLYSFNLYCPGLNLAGGREGDRMLYLFHYSYFKESAGLAEAALNAWQETVNRAAARARALLKTNTDQPISIR